MDWLFLVGVIVFAVGLLASVALHEIGHLVPAKLFNVRVPQYMVGFGPTLWSKRKGETEYGVKWLPLGGYVRLIGMLPPKRGDDPAKLRKTSTGPFQGLIESSREMAQEEIRPGDEDRVFYRKRWWQKVIIMSGGPAMNMVLATILFGIVLMGFGTPTEQPVVASMSQCVLSITDKDRKCGPGDPKTPALAAGVKPGDRFIAVNDRTIESWDQFQKFIREHGPGPVRLTILRDGERHVLTPTLVANQMYALDDAKKVVTVGFLGITPTFENVRQDAAGVAAHMWDLTGRTVGALARFPEKMAGVWQAAFSGQERDRESPIGIVGAGRIGGEIAASELPAQNKIATFIILLASFNLAIGMFNLIPLLPLDGGHIAGALWEGLKRGFARVLKRPQPGYVDIAKALPLTYLMAGILIFMSALLIYADLVNPVSLSG